MVPPLTGSAVVQRNLWITSEFESERDNRRTPEALVAHEHVPMSSHLPADSVISPSFVAVLFAVLTSAKDSTVMLLTGFNRVYVI